MITPLLWVSVVALLTPSARGDFISRDYEGYNSGRLGQRPHVYFRSSEEYSAVLQVNVWNESAISREGSHIFLRHDGNPNGTSTPLVLDARDLSTVYVNRTFRHVFDARVQWDRGRRYLTFWEGDKSGGVGSGSGLVYDDAYRQVYNVSARGPAAAAHIDLHEFALVGNGTALVTGVERVMASTRGWRGWGGGPEFRILDAVFQEVDLETGEVLFAWRAVEHIDPMDSYERMSKDWDAYHLNSVQKTESGNYLISVRHTGSVHLIDGRTGYIVWTLGGRRNDFAELPPAAGVGPGAAPLLSTAWQHHARFVPGTGESELTLFDNHARVTSHGRCASDCSRGLRVALDTAASPPTARLLREYRHPSRLQAQSQGSIQVLPQPRAQHRDDPAAAGDGEDGGGGGGNVFMGWGRCPSFTEHLPTGETVMDVQFSPWHGPETPDALDNYRAYKLDWSATPWWGPALALRNTSGGDLAAYVSWNGATEVRGWVVRGGRGEGGGGGDVLASSPRTGFETRLTVGRAGLAGLRRVWAEALDAEGNILRSTEVVELGGGGGGGGGGGDTVLRLESDESGGDDLVDVPVLESAGVSASTRAWLSIGLAGTVLVVGAGGVFIWRRRRDYDRLEGVDVDSDAGSDVSTVFGMGDFRIDLGPEAYQDYNTAPAPAAASATTTDE